VNVILNETKEMLKNAAKAMSRIGLEARDLIKPKAKFYQTDHARETIAIIEEADGSISIGIARAGRIDIEKRLVTSEDGMRIAEGRARKVRHGPSVLLERNYLRGLCARRVHMPEVAPD